ncbi:MAG: redox-sensitive transcriptional activator SoxR [Pseudomonadota bacterium]
MNSTPLPKALTPGQAASRAGLTVSALHFYEREGLISSWRTSGNQRRYDRAVLRRLGVIKTAQNLGIPLAEIRDKLSALHPEDPPSRDEWAEVASGWREDLSERIAKLTRLRDALDGCIGCGCLSASKCPLNNPNDRAAQRGTGACYVEDGGVAREDAPA